jgi:hypothetical protein
MIVVVCPCLQVRADPCDAGTEPEHNVIAVSLKSYLYPPRNFEDYGLEGSSDRHLRISHEAVIILSLLSSDGLPILVPGYLISVA